MSEGNQLAVDWPAQAAKAVLRVVPRVMQALRAEMRACRTLPLSVPQFRALYFVARHPAASLSDVATHVGVALPSMSRLVEGLVARKLVARTGHAADRRRLVLQLTGRGQALVQAAHALTEASLAARMAALGAEELQLVVRAMELLQPMFAEGATPDHGPRGAKRPSNGDAHA